MKICLIKLDAPYLEYQFSDPPLGLLYVYSMLESKGYDLSFLDMGWDKDIPEADVYGIAATSLDYSRACSVARDIKQLYPKSKIVLGGPHASLFAFDQGHPEIDFYFKGEGESFPALLIQLDSFKSKVFMAPIITNLDHLPFPARHILRKELYFSAPTVFRGVRFAEGNSGTVLTSRGCPFQCAFCSSPKLWKRKVRYRSVENVIQEIDELIEKYNVREIRFQDDNFTLNKEWLKELCGLLAERKVYWRCSTRANLVQYSILETLWNGGCRELGFGVESGEDSVLSFLHKELTVKQQIEALLLTKSFGFRTRVFAMTGLPGETLDSGQKLIDLLEKVNPDVVTLNTFMPIPGSDIWEHPENYNGQIVEKNLDKYEFTLKWEKNRPFAFKPNNLGLDEMEANRERLKAYIFNKRICNCFNYNKEYR